MSKAIIGACLYTCKINSFFTADLCTVCSSFKDCHYMWSWL